jgi:hypothetical protein
MTDEKKSYRVTDRRHSSAEGEEAPGTASVAEAPASEPAPETVAEPGLGDPTAGGQPAAADFAAFIMSLGAQASLLLGGVEGEPPDLKGARWLISILEMLRDKTEGRRTSSETEALEAILYELRLAYVQRARAGGV